MLNKEILFEYIKLPNERLEDKALNPATRYYLEVFRNHCRDGLFNPRQGFGSWNWWACLCGPIWFAYRRMYWFALASMLLITLCFLLPSFWDMFAQIVIAILLGAYGNSLYFTHIDYWAKTGKVNVNKKNTSYIMPFLLVILPWSVLLFVWVYFTASKLLNTMYSNQLNF